MSRAAESASREVRARLVLFERYPRVLSGAGHHQRYPDTKRGAGSFAYFADGLAGLLGRKRASGKDAQSTGLGDRRDEIGLGDPAHPR